MPIKMFQGVSPDQAADAATKHVKDNKIHNATYWPLMSANLVMVPADAQSELILAAGRGGQASMAPMTIPFYAVAVIWPDVWESN